MNIAMRKRITEAVQRSTMKFVGTKTADQLDLQALHRVRQRAVVYRSPQNDTHLALFQTTSAVVPIDPAGLYHFRSCSESDVMIRLLSMPSKFGYELLST